MSEVLLEVNGLKKHFPISGGFLQKDKGSVKAVDGVSFKINKGEALGLVGESGSGKTTIGKTVLRMHPKTAGTVKFNGVDIHSLSKSELRKMRPRMQYIFQDPFSSLDPRMKIGAQIAEPLLQHGLATKDDVYDRVKEVLVQCGLADYYIDRYPHEFSGGQRQRIVIARAMALSPEFIVADEPVSALDVSIQAQIINLFEDLKSSTNLSYLFISHDLSVVEHLCTKIAIMYLGVIVETGTRDELFNNPLHPYTKALLSAIPIPDPTIKRNRILLSGDIPSPADPPKGCRFHTRCPNCMDICKTVEPVTKNVTNSHIVSCHLV